MNILFSCATSYHIFIAQFIAMTKYKHYKKSIIISDLIPEYDVIYENLKQCNTWNNVYLVKEKNTIKSANVNSQELVGQENWELNELEYSNIDIYHIFTFEPGSKMILKNILPNTQVILTEDGIATYILESNKYWLSNMDKINLIMLLDKRLYVGNKYNNLLSNIDIEEYINDEEFSKEISVTFNNIFNINLTEEIPDILFFDQDFSSCSLMTYFEEDLFLSKFKTALSEFEIYFKPHLTDWRLDKYLDDNFKMLNVSKNIPWQLLYLNNMKDCESDKVYITYNSTAVITNKILNRNDRGKIIFLYKLIYFADVYFDMFINNFLKYYGDEDIFIIDSFNELNDLMNKLYKKDAKLVDIKNMPKLDEIKWKKVLSILNHSSNLSEIDMFAMNIRLGYIKKKFNNKNVNYLIWGAGNNGKITKKIMDNIMPNFNLVGFVDKYKEGYFQDTMIYKSKYLNELDFDYIIVATTPGRQEAYQFLDNLDFKIGEEYISLIL